MPAEIIYTIYALLVVDNTVSDNLRGGSNDQVELVWPPAVRWAE
jgi:hypothetical protein